MNCSECIYYLHTQPNDHCTFHQTKTEPTWRCSNGLKQDNRTLEEVEESIAKLQAEKEAIWKPNFGHEEPVQDGGTALLNSTFGMPAMEMLDDLIGKYKINKTGNLEPHDCELISRSTVDEKDRKIEELNTALKNVLSDEARLHDIIDDLSDPVNHPNHYTDGSIEVIDFIEDKKLGYHLGNSVKYICRAGKKDPTKTIQDLQKAAWYINRHIKQLEK